MSEENKIKEESEIELVDWAQDLEKAEEEADVKACEYNPDSEEECLSCGS